MSDPRLTPEAVERIRAAVTTSEVEHLDAATQLIPYVDGTLDAADREIVESHADDCEMCRAELEDLRALSGAQAITPVRTGRIARPPLALAAAIAAVAVALGVLVLRTPSPPEPPTRTVAVVPRPPADPAGETPVQHRYANTRWERLVADAVAAGRLPFPRDLAELDPPAGQTRGGEESPAQSLSPAGVVIDETRPELRWPAAEGETSVVFVYEGETEVLTSGPLQGARWRPDRPLRSGRTYTWQVEIERDGTQRLVPAPPAPPAKFRILTDEQRKEVADALARHPADHLLHAVLYARNGQQREAGAALSRAVAAGNANAAHIRLGR